MTVIYVHVFNFSALRRKLVDIKKCSPDNEVSLYNENTYITDAYLYSKIVLYNIQTPYVSLYHENTYITGAYLYSKIVLYNIQTP